MLGAVDSGLARRQLWWRITSRTRSLTLVIALLPTLTFLGHWSFHVDIPGTNLYLLIVPGEGGAASHDGHSHPDGESGAHDRHCHAGVATCSDVPLTSPSPFAHLGESLALLGAAAALIAVATLYWRPSSDLSVGPRLQPPRFAV